jgi:hypothetical protein
MSGLGARLRRLEDRLGGLCASCTKQPARIELIGPTSTPPPPVTAADACLDCGHVPELVTVLVAFDPECGVERPAGRAVR